MTSRIGRTALAAMLAAAAVAGWSARPAGKPMRWPELLSRARPTGAIRLVYGADPLQVGDLWLPAGAARKPVVLMIHGGCWQTKIADRTLMDWAAADLRDRGIAVWNIDYRGVDRPGGGYPGTFADVAAAADMLPRIADRYHLAADRVVVVGHSAGGHLGLWLAARRRLPPGSVLASPSPSPLPIHAVIGLGALPDLEAARTLPRNDCGATGVRRLVGKPTAARRDVYADTSIPNLLPIGIAQVLVTGARDRIAPTRLATGYAAKARTKGDHVQLVEVPAAGHVELIAPGSRAWTAEVALIRAALGLE